MPRRVALFGLVLLALAAPASASASSPQLTALACTAQTAASCPAGVTVGIGQPVLVQGLGLSSGLRVAFRWSRGTLVTELDHGAEGFSARVPPGVRSGPVALTVLDAGGHRSNAITFTVAPEVAPVAAAAAGAAPLPAVFRGQGMWIWELGATDHGDVPTIARRALAAHFSTVYVKAGDGSSRWSQFSPALVTALHHAGLQVCAWDFVYGTHPSAEAAVAVAAFKNGADCLVIDAEGQYERRYAAAQTYVSAVRKGVGPAFPIGLTSFPYVDYHPNLPYSVFLAPGAAQANLPQVYWKDIGGTVDAVSAHTVAENRVYQVPMAPLGQTYSGPKLSELRRFRQLWSAYGAPGLSWWDWQETTPASFSVLGEATPPTTPIPDPGWPALGQGSQGDQVVWLQLHLGVPPTGKMDTTTLNALAALQTAHGLPVSDETDGATWQAALAQPLEMVAYNR